MRLSPAFGLVLAFASSAAIAQVSTTTTTAASDAPFAPVWTMLTSSELSYASFRGSRGYSLFAAPNNIRGSGNQTYFQSSHSLSGNPTPDIKLDFNLKSGYVRSEQTTFNFQGRFMGPTDTTVSGTMTYLGIDGIQPFLSLNFNLPTGRPSLFGFGGRSRLDPDLVPVPSYGEGFNFGPSAGFNFPVTAELTFNVTAGVTIREAYNREGLAIGNTPFQLFSKYMPGNLTSLSASATYADGPLTAQGSVSYSSDTTAYVDNVATSRSGRRIALSLFAQYALTESLSASFLGSASYGFQNYGVRADTLFAGFPNNILSYANGVLIAEASNSNNAVYSGKITATYAFTPAFSLAPFVSVLYRQNNSYDATSNLFIPAKTRFGIGTSATYAINEKVSITGRVEHIRTAERGSPNKFDLNLLAFTGNGITLGSNVIPLTYSGWQIAGGVNFSF